MRRVIEVGLPHVVVCNLVPSCVVLIMMLLNDVWCSFQEFSASRRRIYRLLLLSLVRKLILKQLNERIRGDFVCQSMVVRPFDKLRATCSPSVAPMFSLICHKRRREEGGW